MSERTILNLVSEVRELKERFPAGFLSEVYDLGGCRGFGICIRIPDATGLDWPKVCIQGSYAEIRSFELAWQRAARAPALSMVAIEISQPVEA